MVNAELNHKCIFVFIPSCLPKLEKLVLMRNRQCEILDCVFSVEKKNPPTAVSYIQIFLLFLQKSGINMASLL